VALSGSSRFIRYFRLFRCYRHHKVFQGVQVATSGLFRRTSGTSWLLQVHQGTLVVFKVLQVVLPEPQAFIRRTSGTSGTSGVSGHTMAHQGNFRNFRYFMALQVLSGVNWYFRYLQVHQGTSRYLRFIRY
jgi:hypothetical protein